MATNSGSKLLPLLVGGGAGAAVTSSDSSWLRELMPDFAARLFSALSPAGAPPRDTTALSASVAATEAAVASLNQAVRAQSGQGARTFLTIATVAVAGGSMAVWRFGWDRVGWASLHELRKGLGNLKASVEGMISQLRTELCEQLLGVQQGLDEANAAVGKVRGAVGDVKEELRAAAAAVAAMEQRMLRVEAATRRSADGVELLVHLVSTTSLSSGASPELAAKLLTFDKEAGGEADPLALPSPPAIQPPPPPGGVLQSILHGP